MRSWRKKSWNLDVVSRQGSLRLPGFKSQTFFYYIILHFSEVAALREEKVEAEKRVEAGLKDLHQKEEKITLLQVKLISPVEIILASHVFFQVQLETALERVSALELEAQPLKTNEVQIFISHI